MDDVQCSRLGRPIRPTHPGIVKVPRVSSDFAVSLLRSTDHMHERAKCIQTQTPSLSGYSALAYQQLARPHTLESVR